LKLWKREGNEEGEIVNAETILKEAIKKVSMGEFDIH